MHKESERWRMGPALREYSSNAATTNANTIEASVLAACRSMEAMAMHPDYTA